ncbi:MAG: hypothetical protein P4M11_00455 [Candidatus Pacebacteria bacterium]|nr:hypothetical protein [Candidatus Paceibacterota bacterium]
MQVTSLPQSPLATYSFSQTQVLEIVFGLIFFVWFLYTLVIIYHWLRYGHRSSIGIPAIIVHLVVSAGLFAMAASGFA